LFARDEVAQWFASKNLQVNMDLAFRQHVSVNIDNLVKRAEVMACKLEREQVRVGIPVV
jgi:transformation/transcription domain-associated protein